jgi:hypothetical protein
MTGSLELRTNEHIAYCVTATVADSIIPLLQPEPATMRSDVPSSESW